MEVRRQAHVFYRCQYHVVITTRYRRKILKGGMIKQNTAKEMREKFKFMKYVFFGRGGIWSVGYFVSTIGLDEQMIQNYVKRQEQEDLGRATLEIR